MQHVRTCPLKPSRTLWKVLCGLTYLHALKQHGVGNEDCRGFLQKDSYDTAPMLLLERPMWGLAPGLQLV